MVEINTLNISDIINIIAAIELAISKKKSPEWLEIRRKLLCVSYLEERDYNPPVSDCLT
jgi:hypothetical protein